MGKSKDVYYKRVKKLVKKYLSKVNQKQSISVKEIIEDFLQIDETIDYDMIERFILSIEKIGGKVIDKSALYKQNMANNPSGNNHISSNMLSSCKNQAVTLYNNFVQKYLLKVNQNLPIDVFNIMEDYLEINSEIDYEKIRKIVETLEKIGAKVINKEVLKNAAFLPATDDDVLTTSDMRYSANDQELEYDDSSLQAVVSIKDVISLLMKDIRNYPVLTPKEEYELAERMAAGDKEAKNKLILSNIRLVISIAKRYCNQSGILGLDDLVSEGIIGLMKAANKFDYRKGYKFSTYATWWITQAITRSIADKARLIRLPVHVLETCNKIKREINRFIYENQRDPTVHDLANALGMNEEQLEQYLIYIEKYMNSFPSLDAPATEDDDSTLKELIAIADYEGVEEQVMANILAEEINNVLRSLTDRESNIITLRFGLHNREPMTLEQIGQIYGVTRERIRQIEVKAIRKLRHPSRRNRLVDWIKS
ncbi:sigma-70 family RNA polymerase sigma factor [Calderihabitans maritimus]|uniref:RNA polymerase sigma factor n=1 Tax=Calderihabitans maritimus TaxID=1246530 RepID=A0A1Z5HXW5_9FIRM|nr:sigma-70 family RNA polymerase sigma factor [Calderihabitans maritimus]GAW94369.1 RpoD subfamily RNA polymerase sigma-70 subunit [Calderihabitans maritimus]